jgi:hypothetical protein
LVAGSALIDVLLAVPFSALHSPDALRLVSFHWEMTGGVWLSVATTLILGIWMVRKSSEG